MLHVSQFGSPAGLGTTSSTDVSNLQKALTAAGQKRPVTGLISDGDMGALWNVLGTDLARAQQVANSISSTAGSAFGYVLDAFNFINDQIKKIPSGFVTMSSVLSNWQTIGQVLANIPYCDTCGTVATALQNARTATADGIAARAGLLASIVNAFSGAKPGAGGKDNLAIKNNLLVPVTGNASGTQIYAPTVTSGGFPAGAVARYNTTRKVWSIYRPLTAALGCPLPVDNGLGGPPAAPAGYTLYTTAATPGTAKIITPEEHDSTPFYKAWWFWTILGVGAAGGVVYYRRKRAHA